MKIPLVLPLLAFAVETHAFAQNGSGSGNGNGNRDVEAYRRHLKTSSRAIQSIDEQFASLQNRLKRFNHPPAQATMENQPFWNELTPIGRAALLSFSQYLSTAVKQSALSLNQSSQRIQVALLALESTSKNLVDYSGKADTQNFSSLYWSEDRAIALQIRTSLYQTLSLLLDALAAMEKNLHGAPQWQEGAAVKKFYMSCDNGACINLMAAQLGQYYNLIDNLLKLPIAISGETRTIAEWSEYSEIVEFSRDRRRWPGNPHNLNALKDRPLDSREWSKQFQFEVALQKAQANLQQAVHP